MNLKFDKIDIEPGMLFCTYIFENVFRLEFRNLFIQVIHLNAYLNSVVDKI